MELALARGCNILDAVSHTFSHICTRTHAHARAHTHTHTHTHTHIHTHMHARTHTHTHTHARTCRSPWLFPHRAVQLVPPHVCANRGVLETISQKLVASRISRINLRLDCRHALRVPAACAAIQEVLSIRRPRAVLLFKFARQTHRAGRHRASGAGRPHASLAQQNAIYALRGSPAQASSRSPKPPGCSRSPALALSAARRRRCPS